MPRKRCCHAAWGVVGEPRQPVARVPPGQQGYRALLPGGYVDAVVADPDGNDVGLMHPAEAAQVAT